MIKAGVRRIGGLGVGIRRIGGICAGVRAVQSASAVSPYLNVTPEATQWVSQYMTSLYEVKSNTDWKVE